MWTHGLQAHDLDITRELLDSVRSTRKRFFQSQKMRSLAKWKSSKDCQLLELNEEIMKLNTETALLKSTTADLQKRSDKLLLDSQKKQTLPEMRNEVTKANTLKSAASKKQ